MKKPKSNLLELLTALPFLPLLLLTIPGTTYKWYLLGACYVYPATAVSLRLGIELSSVGWWLIVLLYARYLACGIHWCVNRRSDKRTSLE